MDAAIATTGVERPRFKDATRVLTSILSPLEKRCLIWLAQRMPARVNSDHLTGLALIAMFAAGVAYWFASLNPWIGLMVVNVCLALNWFGDSLDGTLARVRQHQRPRYGFYVDHIVDAFGMLFLVGGMSLSGYMSPYVALGLLAAYFMLSIEVYLATYSLGTFTITYFKVGPTELRICWRSVTSRCCTPDGDDLGPPYQLFDVGGVVAIIGLMVTLVVSTIRHTRELTGPSRSRRDDNREDSATIRALQRGRRPGDWRAAHDAVGARRFLGRRLRGSRRLSQSDAPSSTTSSGISAGRGATAALDGAAASSPSFGSRARTASFRLPATSPSCCCSSVARA